MHHSNPKKLGWTKSRRPTLALVSSTLPPRRLPPAPTLPSPTQGSPRWMRLLRPTVRWLRRLMTPLRQRLRPLLAMRVETWPAIAGTPPPAQTRAAWTKATRSYRARMKRWTPRRPLTTLLRRSRRRAGRTRSPQTISLLATRRARLGISSPQVIRARTTVGRRR